MGKTMGLCGTFDNNQGNDYKTKEGDIETDTNAFGNRWKTVASCADMPVGVTTDPCETNAQRKQEAAFYCDKLKNSTFSRKYIDYYAFFQQCVMVRRDRSCIGYMNLLVYVGSLHLETIATVGHMTERK